LPAAMQVRDLREVQAIDPSFWRWTVTAMRYGN
jgi:hypothetical protein